MLGLCPLLPSEHRVHRVSGLQDFQTSAFSHTQHDP